MACGIAAIEWKASVPSSKASWVDSVLVACQDGIRAEGELMTMSTVPPPKYRRCWRMLEAALRTIKHPTSGYPNILYSETAVKSGADSASERSRGEVEAIAAASQRTYVFLQF